MSRIEEQLKVSEAISSQLKAAITNAIKEEKEPRLKLFATSLGKASVLAALTSGLLFCFWSASFSTEWIVACIAMWGLLLVGFLLYTYPQPRLAVRGYWSTWVFAKLLIAMTLVSALQLIVCPHFAFMEKDHANPFAIFTWLTDKYAEWGGMNGCMFLCGITFSFIGSAIGFSFVRRHFSFSQKRDLLTALAIATTSQSPIIILQLQTAHSREMLLFWLLGSCIAFALTAGLLKLVGERLLLQK